VKKKIAKKLKRRKQRIQYRLRDINWKQQYKPMFLVAIHCSNFQEQVVKMKLGRFFTGFDGKNRIKSVAFFSDLKV
jgi:hypothetical protein